MEINKDMNKIIDVITEMSKENNYYKLLEEILEVGMDISQSDGGTLYLLKEDKLEFFFMITKSQNIKNGGMNQKIDLPPVDINSNSVAALCAKYKKIINIPDVYQNSEYNLDGPKKYDAITGYHTKSVLVLPLFDRDKNVLGVMQLINAIQDGKVISYSEDITYILSSLSSLSGILLDNINLYDNIKELFDSFVRTMVKAIESRTPYNALHTLNVAKYCSDFVDFLNRKGYEKIDDNDKEEIIMAAMLHDVGKMIINEETLNKATRFGNHLKHMLRRYDLILSSLENMYMNKEIDKKYFDDNYQIVSNAKTFMSDLDKRSFVSDEDLLYLDSIKDKEYNTKYGILRLFEDDEFECAHIKKGTLTREERIEIERHVVYTDQILSELKFGKKYAHVKEMAAEHHEFLDGSGYPNHRKAKEISKYVRIITIADIYDSLRADDRPYKKPMPNEKALSILEEMVSEGKLDGILVEQFREFRGEC